MSDTRIRVREGYAEVGKQGYLLAGPIQDCGGMDWMVVQWDGEDDPDLYKAKSLEVSTTIWKPVTP
jgi:hypothetical protein